MSKFDIPIDVPGYPFVRQLEIVAKWANLGPSLFLSKQNKIARVFKDREKAIPILLKCCPPAPWDWPAYAAHIAEKLAEVEEEHDDPEDAPTADDIREFHRDERRDMVEHVYDKLRSNFYALYRKHQMDGLKKFRPFWQIVGSCSGGDRRTLLADDEYWQNGCAPWNCPKLDCGCRVDSLTRTEFARYVERGCESDPSAVELLKAWEAHENSNPNRVTCTVTVKR